jgi:uncharacterized repeat protein (TIGR01451 family)
MRAARQHGCFALLVLLLCAVSTGCGPLRGWRIDPSGQRLFVRDPQPPKLEPSRVKCTANSAVSITPTQVVAPVGAEVVLTAGVCDLHGGLKKGERVEWMLSPAGVGQIVTINQPPFFERFMNSRHRSQKIDNLFAVSHTGKKDVQLTRGTPTPVDDVTVKSGQTWLTVTSAVEGTSFMTAYAPDVFGWDSRQATTLIHWLDAQWTFPPAAVNPVGSRQLFTTMVQRFSDRTPVSGWRVRYEILDGPGAGFSPDGGRMIEMFTDEFGQARAEIMHLDNTAGTNNIAIQLIRPAELGGAGGRRLIVANGTTQMTWTSGEVAQLAVRGSGPVQASPGATATYRFDVTNPGPQTANGVAVNVPLPEGFSLVSSVPSAGTTGTQLDLRIGDLTAGQTQTVELNLRADRAGSFNICATAVSANGMTAQDCVSTTVMSAALDVQMTAPEQALLGEEVAFEVTVTNRGTTPLSGVKLVSRFDPGLEHTSNFPSPIERDIEELAPGQSRKMGISFRVTQRGRLCNRVEMKTVNGVLGNAEACINAFEPQRTTPGGITVRKTGPEQMGVGETAEFTIDVTNAGTAPLRNLRITDSYDSAFQPVAATDGYTLAGRDLVWSVASLEAGKTIRYQVNCRGTVAAESACNRVTVTSDDGARADDQACVRVGGGGPATPPPPTTPTGGLTVSVSDRRDFVAVGKELTYEVLVTNNSSQPDRGVTVSVRVPPEMTPIPLGTSGPARASISGQQVLFEPVVEMRPNETLRYQIRVMANRQGEVRFQAQATSANSPTPVVKEETTSIFGEQ